MVLNKQGDVAASLSKTCFLGGAQFILFMEYRVLLEQVK